jgi:hypothetical protein
LDIVLVLYGDVPVEMVDRLWTLFDASNLTVKVECWPMSISPRPR